VGADATCGLRPDAPQGPEPLGGGLGSRAPPSPSSGSEASTCTRVLSVSEAQARGLKLKALKMVSGVYYERIDRKVDAAEPDSPTKKVGAMRGITEADAQVCLWVAGCPPELTHRARG
jgi:hypothetical protein